VDQNETHFKVYATLPLLRLGSRGMVYQSETCFFLRIVRVRIRLLLKLMVREKVITGEVFGLRSVDVNNQNYYYMT